jgi:hypothetical protein
VFQTVTEDLSSRGFHCVVDEVLTPGERLSCVLSFPFNYDGEISPSLRCEAQVVWVKPTDEGRLGIGCRIDDYTVIA